MASNKDLIIIGGVGLGLIYFLTRGRELFQPGGGAGADLGGGGGPFTGVSGGGGGGSPGAGPESADGGDFLTNIAREVDTRVSQRTLSSIAESPLRFASPTGVGSLIGATQTEPVEEFALFGGIVNRNQAASIPPELAPFALTSPFGERADGFAEPARQPSFIERVGTGAGEALTPENLGFFGAFGALTGGAALAGRELLRRFRGTASFAGEAVGGAVDTVGRAVGSGDLVPIRGAQAAAPPLPTSTPAPGARRGFTFVRAESVPSFQTSTVAGVGPTGTTEALPPPEKPRIDPARFRGTFGA